MTNRPLLVLMWLGCGAVSSSALAYPIGHTGFELYSTPGYDVIGLGAIKYDRGYVDGLLQPWLELGNYCENTIEPDEVTCADWNQNLEIALPILDARLRFQGNDVADSNDFWQFVWYFDWLRGRNDYEERLYAVQLGISGSSTSLYWAAGDDVYTLAWTINGVDRQPNQYLYWSDVYVPEPGTLALLGLGLAGLGLSRRRTAN